MSPASFVPTIAAPTVRKPLLYFKMSDQTNSSQLSDHLTFLSNPSLSFIEIVSLLAREQQLNKFQQIVATTTLKNIATALAHVLEGVLVFKPQQEAMITQEGKFVFREDLNYYIDTDAGEQWFNPFTWVGPVPGDVRCAEDSSFYLTKPFLDNIWSTLDYVFVTNPLLNVMVADLLTVVLNQEQLWVKKHGPLLTHFMQNYVDLEKLVRTRVPEMGLPLLQLQGEVTSLRQDFAHEFFRNKPQQRYLTTDADLARIYEARGKQNENKAIQEFWDRPEIQDALNDLQMAVEKIITGLFPTVRAVAERSSLPAFGYDVFFATVANNTEVILKNTGITSSEVVLKNLGDYRVLHWEINNEL